MVVDHEGRGHFVSNSLFKGFNRDLDQHDPVRDPNCASKCWQQATHSYRNRNSKVPCENVYRCVGFGPTDRVAVNLLWPLFRFQCNIKHHYSVCVCLCIQKRLAFKFQSGADVLYCCIYRAVWQFFAVSPLLVVLLPSRIPSCCDQRPGARCWHPFLQYNIVISVRWKTKASASWLSVVRQVQKSWICLPRVSRHTSS